MNHSLQNANEVISSLANDIQAKIDGLTGATSDESLVSIYFEIGAMLNANKLNDGDINALSEKLSTPSSEHVDFSAKNLLMMARFYAAYGNHDVLKTLITAVDWPKHVAILEEHTEEMAQEFYIRMARKFGWSHEVLIEKLKTFKPKTS